jgi:hypothetical protein
VWGISDASGRAFDALVRDLNLPLQDIEVWAERTVEELLSVQWEFWRITQSQYHYRPVGEFDLGEIG